MTDDITVQVHADAGVEPNDIGTSSWAAAAAYGKFQVTPVIYAAVRGDYFYEYVASSGGTTATPIFWPVKWVAEGTATLAYQPVDHVSVRLEYRHDQAAAGAVIIGREQMAEDDRRALAARRQAVDNDDHARVG